MPPERVDGLSPIKLFSDGSSEGLPSPEALRAALFSEQSHSQPKTPSKSSFAHANVIILDDTPPSPKGKRISSLSTLQCERTTSLCNSQGSIDESLSKYVVNPQPVSPAIPMCPIFICLKSFNLIIALRTEITI
jgi:hypothetical protein